MATHASASDVSTIKALYEVYRLQITSTIPENQALWLAQATYALNKWADAELAIINVNAATASSYSSGVGGSFQKKQLDDLKAASDDALEEFLNLCQLGGMNIPNLSKSVSFWDMSRNSWGQDV